MVADSLKPTHWIHHSVPDAVGPGEEVVAEAVFERKFSSSSIGLHNACEAGAVAAHLLQRLRSFIDNEAELPSS